MKKDTLIIIGRWLAILPVVVIAFALTGIVVNIFFTIQGWFFGTGFDSFWGKFNYWIMSSAISAGAGVYFGSRVAPSYRKIVSMILTALIVGLALYGIWEAVTNEIDVVWSILASVASAVAAGFIAYKFFEQGDDYDFSI